MDDALRQRGSLSIWFDPEMPWHAPATGKRGRQPEFSDASIQFCLTMKVLFGMVVIVRAIGPSDNDDPANDRVR